jgi:hypothetical protein
MLRKHGLTAQFLFQVSESLFYAIFPMLGKSELVIASPNLFSCVGLRAVTLVIRAISLCYGSI